MGLMDNISLEDMNRVDSKNNPPDYEHGFEDESSNGNFNDIFGDSFSSSSEDSLGGIDFGGSNDWGSSDTSSNWGSSGDSWNSIGGSWDSGGGIGFNDPFNSMGGYNVGYANQQQAVEVKPTITDKAFDQAIETSKDIGNILLDMAKSFRLRTIDDIGYLGSNLLKVGGIIVPASLVLGIVFSVAGLKAFSFSGLASQLALAGALSVSTGIICIGGSAFILPSIADKEDELNKLDMLSDADSDDNAISDYEANSEIIAAEAFDDSFDDLFSVDDSSNDSGLFEGEYEEEEEDVDNNDFDTDVYEFNPEGMLDNVNENQYITRELLFNTFKSMLPLKTPDFADKAELDSESQLYRVIETACLKALSRVQKCTIEDVDSKLISVYDGLFSYEIKMSRPDSRLKEDDLAREIEHYFRDNADDRDTNALVMIEADYLRIIVTKGKSAIVTFGDIFKNPDNCKFFLDEKNKLPMITGITELGKVILEDAKVFDSMLIAGKPRSGKSWYVLSILMSLMLFNTPEDVIFVIVDPKSSVLFKTMALMPHVVGLHEGTNILDIINELINIEAPRRKKLFEDYEVDDIWALRKKGIKLPVMYLIMDEYITIKNGLGDASKELDKLLQTVITQLPSVGIRPLLVPHRSQGVVDKTNRGNISFSAAVKADNEVVEETLGISKWNRPLVSPGDTAVMSNGKSRFVRGAALTIEDGQNTEFIKTAAKAFYKMGVDIPDTSNLTICCNRDNEYIKEKLSDNSARVQFNAANLLKDLD